MLQLHPGEKFIIVRGIEDHSDSRTYYVQAVIRNADSDVILKTVNLTDKGDGHRFSAEWYVPQNPGQGFYIIITTSVYTDSGYTTKSGNYGDKYDTYLVQERLTRMDMPMGGADISYKKIEAIIKKVVDERKMQGIPKVNLENVLNQLSRINDFLSNLKIPAAEKFNYEKIINVIETFRKEVANGFKSIPAPEKIDFSPVIKINNENLLNSVEQILSALRAFVEAVKEETAKNAEIGDKKIKPILDLVNKFTDKAPILKLMMPEEEEKEDNAAKIKIKKNRPFLNRKI
ncbi:MAG: hypothetical protein WC619_01870 [Patescibacteria group bacterium]